MVPRPRFRLPIWSAVAIVGAAYAARSFLRGSLRPDLPLDLIVLMMLAAVVAMVAYVRAQDADGSRPTPGSAGGSQPASDDAVATEDPQPTAERSESERH